MKKILLISIVALGGMTSCLTAPDGTKSLDPAFWPALTHYLDSQNPKPLPAPDAKPVLGTPVQVIPTK